MDPPGVLRGVGLDPSPGGLPIDYFLLYFTMEIDLIGNDQ
jgi:hypothetical protein